MQSLRLSCGQMGRFPIHRHPDPGATAGMIEEDEFFQRRRIELAVFTQFKRYLRECVRFARRIDTKSVRFAFVNTDGGVDDGRKEKEHRREDEREQRKAGRIGNAVREGRWSRRYCRIAGRQRLRRQRGDSEPPEFTPAPSSSLKKDTQGQKSE